MIEYLTPERISNALEMNNAFGGVFLLVEGITDEVLFSKFINSNTCKIYIAHGKPNVVGAVRLLNDRNFNRVLGVVDRDFDDILKINITDENIVASDYHDIGISILESASFNYILTTHGDINKISEVENTARKNLKDICYELVYDLGVLKLANKMDNLGLSFKPDRADGRPLPYSDFVDGKSFTFSGSDKLITTSYNYSINRKVKPQSIQAITAAYHRAKAMAPFDLKQLCNGHDITFIIQLALKKKIGSLNASECSQKRIELDLIFSYDSRYFVQTQLYRSIKDWESQKNKSILLF